MALNAAADLPAKISDGVILVSTIQLINEMARNRPTSDAYDRLAAACDAVMVDEGHYEPAFSWSQALRGLGFAANVRPSPNRGSERWGSDL